MMSPKKDETAVHCCDPALSVLVMFGVSKLLSRSISLAFRESAFNMTRGDEDIEGGSKILDIRKGGSEKIMGGSENLYTSKPTGEGGGLLKN